MKFHYEFPIKKIPVPLTHYHKTLMIGSCFTENIGNLLKRHCFTVLENPNGILFNPVSVVEAVDSYIHQKQINESDLFLLNETWHSWKHHSRFSDITPAATVAKINASTFAAGQFLKSASHIMITLGSAWVYRLTDAADGEAGSVAANNHKAPSTWFTRELLTAEITQKLLQQMVDSLLKLNPYLQIIFTISPVRHLREGVIDNNRSKAVLIQAVHDLVNQNVATYYFPAYELVIDDLRDYRFYAEDLVHPNYQATQYVWEKLVDACIAKEASDLFKLIKEIKLAYQHKPFNPQTIQHQQFLRKYENETARLMEQFPFIQLTDELNYFKTGFVPREQF
ncbi:GSCFA domain-containing protein [Sediminibacterium sp.]|uniref:GSCFA domain-containing protein n=1 Tax=Sediminibacterium sp. TaxID=1917865 RepID=UPI003F717242